MGGENGADFVKGSTTGNEVSVIIEGEGRKGEEGEREKERKR